MVLFEHIPLGNSQVILQEVKDVIWTHTIGSIGKSIIGEGCDLNTYNWTIDKSIVGEG